MSSVNLQSREGLIQEFLCAHGHGSSVRTHLTGDASSRAYEYVQAGQADPVILMNAPQQPDGPPIRDGKPYSQIARLAEDIRAFVGVAMMLEEHGFRVPKIHAQELDHGLLLIEDLGNTGIITDQRQPIDERYVAAIETLKAVHEKQWPDAVQLQDGSQYSLANFDQDAMMIEVDLLAQWYAPYKLGRSLADQELAELQTIWRNMIGTLQSAEHSIVLRDYHSPNIIWMAGCSGTDRTGLIDFQDALRGPSAYDVASLAQDARVDVSAELETLLLDHYCKLRTGFDEEQFRAAYAVLAAQRATKILGIFVRLWQRDGKDVYLAHLPRIESYLQRSLKHPVLREYKAWAAAVLNI